MVNARNYFWNTNIASRRVAESRNGRLLPTEISPHDGRHRASSCRQKSGTQIKLTDQPETSIAI
jgi:hypothetical protein